MNSPASVPGIINPLPPPPGRVYPSLRQESNGLSAGDFPISSPSSAGNVPSATLHHVADVHAPAASSSKHKTNLTAETLEAGDESPESISEESESNSDSDSSEENHGDNKESADKLSARISNRSSPSVLSATIHQWPGYEEESHGLLENPEDVSDESDNDDPDDPWRIQPDQRGWYLTLFLRLQPDVHGYVEGHDARLFFENSHLPVTELSEIWTLSDCDRDGRLTLSEFCYAMHLSLARRHGHSLPTQLPSSLRSSTRTLVKAALESIAGSSEDQHRNNTNQTEWTQFGESPRNRGPIQFREAIEKGSDLAHPVPVKQLFEGSVGAFRPPTATRDVRSYSTGTVTLQMSAPQAPQPAPRHLLHGVPEREATIAPPPPPRSWHSRSASLDMQGPAAAVHVPTRLPTQVPPPQLPPRSSPTMIKHPDSFPESEGDRLNDVKHVSEAKPEKPPRVTKPPHSKVSHESHGASERVELQRTIPASLVTNVHIPSSEELEAMPAKELASLVGQLRIVVEGLSKQNFDLQHQLTEVVLKKRTAESQLATEQHKEKVQLK